MTELITILSHTPSWVFIVFTLLLVLGVSQWHSGSRPFKRAVIVPLALAAWSLYNSVTGLGHAPLAFAAWAAAALVCGVLVMQIALPAATRYDPATQRFHQPGSPVPLILMMGIFVLRYGVGVTLAMHPDVVHQAIFAVGVGGASGAFSGIFASRALRLLRLTLQTNNAQAHA